MLVVFVQSSIAVPHNVQVLLIELPSTGRVFYHLPPVQTEKSLELTYIPTVNRTTTPLVPQRELREQPTML